MAEALDPAAYIHAGFWTNWSKGAVTGRTLTLSPTYATLLTNSLALFVTLSGGQLWTILRFSLHQYRASRKPEVPNASRQQEQVVLRNATTNFATLRLMSQVAWASRRNAGRPFMFCFLIVSVALVHAVFFMIAGAFSNNVANAGQEVLSRSKFCGIFNEPYLDTASVGINPTSSDTMQLSVEWFRKLDHDIQLSHEYAEQCYASQPKYYMSSTCSTMKNATVSFSQTTSASCPFDDRLCHENSETVTFDTGKIDSHRHLGINSRPVDRISYQRITTCAALNDTDHVTGWNGSREITQDPSPSNNVAYANYGPSFGESTPWTYSYSDFASSFTNFSSQVEMPYQVSAQRAYAGAADSSDFAPLAALEHDSADLTLLFLSFIGGYTQQVSDPWFSALHSHEVDAPFPIYQTQFQRDRAISTVGCTEQHQFCTSDGICTPFLGIFQIQELKLAETGTFASRLNPQQAATFDRVFQAAGVSITGAIVASLALTNTPLQAMSAVASTTQVLSLHLPDDQWQQELSYWQSIAMAHLQRTVVEYGTGQIAAQPQYLIIPPPEEGDKWFCNNLMINSTVYQSFSVLALALITSSGTLVILISLFIEDTAAWVQKRARRAAFKRESWDCDDMLRLHRASRAKQASRAVIAYSPPPEPPPKDFYPVMSQCGYEQRGSHLPEKDSSNPHSTPSNTSLRQLQPLSPERMWSDLPPQPLRDSWIARNHESFDFGFPEERVSKLRRAHLRDRDVRGPEIQPSTQHSWTPRRLELSELREHAIARTKSTWV